MTVDPAWEAAHAARAWGKYPHPAVVEFIGRNYGMLEPNTVRPPLSALDIGCGAGGSTLFMAREGFKTTGVDASRSALSRLADRACEQDLAPLIDLYPSDVTSMVFPWALFDVALDVCCLSCVSYGEALGVVLDVADWLKPGGRFLSVMAADDCDTAVHGEFKVRQTSRVEVDAMFKIFPDVFVGKHTRLTQRGFISEWVVEAQK